MGMYTFPVMTYLSDCLQWPGAPASGLIPNVQDPNDNIGEFRDNTAEFGDNLGQLMIILRNSPL